MPEYKKKDKLKSSSSVYDDYKNKGPEGAYYKNNKAFWWNDDSNYSKERRDKKYNSQAREVLKDNPDVGAIISPGGRKIIDIPHKMGYFETQKAGTISVGFNRYDKRGDLGFTVVSNVDKGRKGIPERDEDDSNTYFGGNFDGKMQTFRAGAVSFRYNRKTEEIDKIKREKNENYMDDEESLLYQDKKEKNELEKLKEEKTKNPDIVSHLNKKQKKVERIIDLKRKENNDFIKEIKDFIKKLKNGKVKMLVEADEAAKRKRRVIELSSKHLEVEELRIMLKRILSEEDVEDLLADLLIKAKIRGFDEKELLNIVNNLRKEDLRK